nr:chitin deacetylase 1-like isoform X1 [Hydra vulgaris]
MATIRLATNSVKATTSATIGTPGNITLPHFEPTKKTYDAATFCDFSKCVLPKCRCGGEDIPGGLTIDQTPQIVVLTFDGGVRDSNFNIYKPFLNNIYKNPNGCPIRATFFVTHANTIYENVKSLHDNGHEIADHSLTDRTPDTWWKTSTYEELDLEISGQKQNIEKIGVSDVKGWRSPFLAIGENTYKILSNRGFLYSSSISLVKGQRWWPYTMDYLNKNLPDLCPNCPRNSYPGLWEVPLNQWDDGTTSYTCSYFDACFRSLVDGDSDSVYKLFMDNFRKFYKDRKQPFTAFGHGAFFDHPSYTWRIEGFMKFLREILNLPDVYFVTVSQAIQWVQQPTPLHQLKDFKPWQC